MNKLKAQIKVPTESLLRNVPGYGGLYNKQSADGNHFKGYYSIQFVSKDWSVLLITLSFLAFDLDITQALFG